MKFDETNEFSKDFKRLSKKYKSLADDLFELKKVVSKFPLGISKHFVVLIAKETVKIIKGRLFCRYLKGYSLRIIYAYCEKKHRVEFIQLYFKGDKGNKDHNRIKNYLDNFKQ